MTGSISGQLLDASGATLPSVTVEIRNIGTGARHSAVSDATGNYQASALPAGTYDVTVGPITQANVQVRPNENVVVDFVPFAPDIRLQSSAATLSLQPSQSATCTIVVQSANGFSGTVRLSESFVGNVPSELAGRLTPTQMTLTPGQTLRATLTITATGSRAIGSHTLRVTAVSGVGISRALDISVTVSCACTNTSQLARYTLSLYETERGAVIHSSFRNDYSAFWQFSPCGDLFMLVTQANATPAAGDLVGFYSTRRAHTIYRSLTRNLSANPSATVVKVSDAEYRIQLTGMSEASMPSPQCMA